MSMAEKRAFEFRVLRYVPNPVQDVAANVGVILVEIGARDAGFADVKLTEDWRLAKLLNPFFEVDVLVNLAEEIRQSLRSSDRDCSKGGEAVSRTEWILHILDDWFSNAIMVSEPRALMTEEPAVELGRLVKDYCEIVKLPGEGKQLPGRNAILRRMKDEFTSYGVLKLMSKDIAIEKYTRAGDPLKIDYGYRYPTKPLADVLPADQVFRMFHALSLRSEVNAAKALALTFSGFRQGLQDEVQARVDLTAIVEDDVDRDSKSVQFAVATLKDYQIIVEDVGQLPRIAQRANKELEI